MSLAPKPKWLKIKLPGTGHYHDVRRLLAANNLHTVCSSARCPNIGDCWARRTATFMILGNVCTRNCRFCAVEHGQPSLPDDDEPRRTALAVQTLSLRYAVVTSVTRDDLADGGAAHFAAVIREIKKLNPHCLVEVLIPDFQGDEQALATVLQAQPDVLNHNVETAPRLYALVRPQADFERSLQVIRRSDEKGFTTKSGLMLGLGETHEEVLETACRLRRAGCQILTLGQYLSPSQTHLPVYRFVPPEEFSELHRECLTMGFTRVQSAPLVRSSYHADEQMQAAQPVLS